jgi:putative membrane protein
MRKTSMTASLAVLFAVLLTGCRENAGQPQTDTTGTVQAASETTTASATTTGSTGGTSSNMTADDKDFVSKAGMGGLAEVQIANVALQNAASADVKAFAQRMVDDHSKANGELQELATTKGLALPAELSGEPKEMLQHLSSLHGAEFDKAYMKDMVEDHEKDVAEFDKASTSATDSDLKAWAGKTLPTLKDHLEHAKRVARKV